LTIHREKFSSLSSPARHSGTKKERTAGAAPRQKAVCRRALDAAVEASANLKIRNLEREAADLPFADVDIALHVGEVLYGNVASRRGSWRKAR
jgi:hypothetical protein